AVFGQVDTAGLDQFQQRCGAVWQLASVVALRLELAEQVPQGGGHVEVVGADVVASGGVVVVNQRHFFVVIGQGGEALPVVDTRRQPRRLGGAGARYAETQAGQRVEGGRLRGGDHKGLAGALEFRHADPVVHFI